MTKTIIILLKLAKQALEKKQKELLFKNTQIKELYMQIDSINIQISSINMPTSGTFKQYQNIKDSINHYLYEIDLLKQDISIKKDEKKVILKELKLAHIEHEKLSYLNQKNKEEALKKEQTLAAKNLDEVSVILHAHKQ